MPNSGASASRFQMEHVNYENGSQLHWEGCRSTLSTAVSHLVSHPLGDSSSSRLAWSSEAAASEPSKQAPLFHGGGMGGVGAGEDVSGCTVGNFTSKTWCQRATGTAWNKCCL